MRKDPPHTNLPSPVSVLFIFALLLSAALLQAEIVDQIAVKVGNQVITASEIREALRVAAFLDGEDPDLSPAARRTMADRLIEQILVRREMELTRYPEPSPAEIAAELNQVRRRFAGEAEFQHKLAAYRLTQREIENAIGRQIALLRYIDLRFRPEVQVAENEAMQYYETVYLPEIRKQGVTPEPSFEDARDDCEEALTARLVDKRVDAWLAQARGRTRIDYDEDAFR